MNNYQDKYTRWHDKPCINGEPKSNNGWIYTAYAKHLKPGSTDIDKKSHCFNDCAKSFRPFLKVDRLPDDPTPPMSKDEIIGLVSLGLVNNLELQASHWNFCNFMDYSPRKLSIPAIFRAVKALYKIRKEHRNYVWENKVVEAYPLAFYLAPHDQYYVNKYFDGKVTILQTILFYINIITVLTGSNLSVKLMLWLQLEDLNHKWAKKLPKDKWLKEYFGEDHPFVKDLK